MVGIINGKNFAEDIARQLVSVQPMDGSGKALNELYKQSKTKEELIAEGYNPVSNMGLMWIKENEN